MYVHMNVQTIAWGQHSIVPPLKMSQISPSLVLSACKRKPSAPGGGTGITLRLVSGVDWASGAPGWGVSPSVVAMEIVRLCCDELLGMVMPIFS